MRLEKKSNNYRLTVGNLSPRNAVHTVAWNFIMTISFVGIVEKSFWMSAPKCGSIRIGMSEWGNIKCLECGFEYSMHDLFKELLIGCPDPSSPYLRILNQHQVSGSNCYNIGTNKNTIWELCEEYNCPFEEKCEYYCPAFLSVLGLIERGKVTTGLPWGYDRGGDLYGYRIRWKRPKWKRE